MPRRNPPPGITLILALLIMSAVVAIGVTVSAIVVQQVRLNAVASDSHQGYYATESGLEQGLYQVGTLKTQSLGAALNQLTSVLLPSGADATLFPANYQTASLLSQSTSSDSTQTIPNTLDLGQSVTIELYNVDDSLATPTGGAFALTVSGEGDSASILEVSWVAWDENLQTSRVQRIYVAYTAFSAVGGFTVPLDQFYPAFGAVPVGYRIRVTALKSAVGAGNVTNFSVTTTPPTASQIQLKSVSSLRGNTQALVASFPWALPLSSLFDFVIFSQGPLTKNQPITISQEARTYGPYAPVNPDLNYATLPSEPFDVGVCSSCSYYVRLQGDGVTTLPQTVVRMKNDDSDPISQTIATQTAFQSCIIPQPFGPFVSTDTHEYGFSQIAGLTGFYLLSQPTFIGPEENFCPTL